MTSSLAEAVPLEVSTKMRGSVGSGAVPKVLEFDVNA